MVDETEDDLLREPTDVLARLEYVVTVRTDGALAPEGASARLTDAYCHGGLLVTMGAVTSCSTPSPYNIMAAAVRSRETNHWIA